MDAPHDLSPQSSAVLDAVHAGFPVTWAPYCELGERVALPEVDVLNIVLDLRQSGVIPRIGAAFGARLDDATDADRELMFLLYDIPTSEHPFDELHEMLEFKGVDVTRGWVEQRINEWLGSGVISRFGALPVDVDPE